MTTSIYFRANLIRHLTILATMFASSSFVQSQTIVSPVQSTKVSSAAIVPLDSEPPPVYLPPEIILERFIATERRLRDELNQHTFKRDVVLQTIGLRGEITGEYIRNSQFTFDDQGNRIEKVLFHPKSTITELKITKEDIQDLAGAQLLGIDILESTKYRLKLAGTEIFNSQELIVIDVSPVAKPDPYRMRERFFVGRVWIDLTSFQVLKVRGITEPQGKQRFPVFETWRESTGGPMLFPVRTEADDVLHFPDRDVHYRIKVRYHDYKRFSSRVKITEIAKTEDCITNRNAPPAAILRWPRHATVSVMLARNIFTDEERNALFKAMDAWTITAQKAGAGVKFVYRGETDSPRPCDGCLIVTRKEVQKIYPKAYALFFPRALDQNGFLTAARIDLDLATTDLRALQGMMLHELGHGMGLANCDQCKKKRTIMRGFPGINRDSGLSEPTDCDLEVVRRIYQSDQAASLNTVAGR